MAKNQLHVFKLNDRDGLSPKEYWGPIVDAEVKEAIDAGETAATSWEWYGRNIGGPMFLLVLTNPSAVFLAGLAEHVTMAEKDVSIFNDDLPRGFKIRTQPVCLPEPIYPECERDEDGNIIPLPDGTQPIGFLKKILSREPIEEVVYYAEEV